jgi:prevent-host-death family protein
MISCHEEKTLRLTGRVHSLTHVKSHAPAIVRELAEGGEPVVITLRGEAKAVLVDLESWERTQATLALLKLLALAEREVAADEVVPAAEAFAEVRAKAAARRAARG